MRRGGAGLPNHLHTATFDRTDAVNSNAIDDEIRQTRDALVRDCGGDLERLGDHLRMGEARWVAAGPEQNLASRGRNRRRSRIPAISREGREQSLPVSLTA
jgi:hypothetical protein